MPVKPALILALAIFLITLLVRLPARALLSALPSQLSCSDATGTVWNGSCAELRCDGIAISNLAWTVHPAALLRARLVADLASPGPRAAGRASIELARNGDLDVRALSATLPLQGGPALFPAGWNGTLELAIDAASIRAQHLVAVQGKASVRQLHVDKPPAELGSFELLFAPQAQDSAMQGQLRDLDGPLALSGQLRLMPDGAYELTGTVAARASASPELQRLLQLLGPADAQGRQMFSVAGTL